MRGSMMAMISVLVMAAIVMVGLKLLAPVVPQASAPQDVRAETTAPTARNEAFLLPSTVATPATVIKVEAPATMRFGTDSAVVTTPEIEAARQKAVADLLERNRADSAQPGAVSFKPGEPMIDPNASAR